MSDQTSQIRPAAEWREMCYPDTRTDVPYETTDHGIPQNTNTPPQGHNAVRPQTSLLVG